MDFPGCSVLKKTTYQPGDMGWEYPLEEGMATHPSIFAGKIPWTGDHGGLQSIRLQRIRHNLVTKL